jgi:hypothetical protein
MIQTTTATALGERRRAWGHGVLALWVLAFAVFVAGEVLFFLNLLTGDGPAFPEGWFLLITALADATIGALVLSRQPGHRVGWVLYAIGLLLATSYFLDDYAMYALRTDPGALPFGREAAALEVIGSVAFGLMAGFLPLLFPHGDVPSPRWRPVLYVASVVVITLLVSVLVRPGELGEPFDFVTNPFGIEGAEDVAAAVAGISFLALAAIGIANLYGLFSRFRRVDGIERRQLEWFAYGIGVLATVAVISVVSRLAGFGSDTLGSILFSIGFTAIPVSVGIAILRYRLYEIDWIINRTLVYLPLTAILAGLYVAMTGLLRSLFTEVTQQASDAAIAFTTLVVAGSLTTVKNWLQVFVDRHFKEADDADRTLKRMTAQARSVIEVLQAEAFLRKFLRELTAAFDAPGGMIRVGPTAYIEGEWAGTQGMQATLCEGTSIEAYVALAEREEPYSQADQARFVELTAVLGEIILVGPYKPAGIGAQPGRGREAHPVESR